MNDIIKLGWSLHYDGFEAKFKSGIKSLVHIN